LNAKLLKNKDYYSKNDCFIGFGFLSCRTLDFYKATFYNFKFLNSNLISKEIQLFSVEIIRFKNNFLHA